MLDMEQLTEYPRHTKWTACTPERSGKLPKYVDHLKRAKDRDHLHNWLISHQLTAGQRNN